MHPLTGPWEKLKRAENQVKMLGAEISRFLMDGGHQIVVAERDISGEHYALRARVPREPPLEWGVLTGEIVHNLRSTLDALLWQLITLNGIDPETLTDPLPAFPIYLHKRRTASGRPGYLTKSGKSRIFGRVRAGRETMIEQLQPYYRRNGGRDSSLWILQELNNADKHRLFQVAAGRTAKFWSNFIFGFRPVNLTFTEIRQLIRFRNLPFFIDGAKIGTIHREAVEKEVNMKLQPVMQIAFWKGCDAVKGRPLFDILHTIGGHVASIVGRFAKFFPPYPTAGATH